jgi:GNAT superfamily N-acetyltransferase
MLTIREAIDAFIEGWVYSRRMEREISVSQFGAITRLRFGEAANVRSRFDEFMIYETPLGHVFPVLRHEVSTPHLLSVFTTEAETSLSTYASEHYHLRAREYLMAIRLPAENLPPPANVPVDRVTTEADRQWYNTAHDREVIPPRAVGDPHIGYYFIRIDDELACEARCILIPQNIALIDSVYTADTYRRRGLGSTIMTTILNDATQNNAAYSVLVASEDGRKLYLTLGYQVLADMLILEPDV